MFGVRRRTASNCEIERIEIRRKKLIEMVMDGVAHEPAKAGA
jgi:hypothetical protein